MRESARAADEIGTAKKEMDTLKKGQGTIEKEPQEINTNCLNANDPNRARADVCGASLSQTVTDP